MQPMSGSSWDSSACRRKPSPPSASKRTTAASRPAAIAPPPTSTGSARSGAIRVSPSDQNLDRGPLHHRAGRPHQPRDPNLYLQRPLDIERLAAAIRGHWGVESVHWLLDVEFKDDLSRYRQGYGAKNMA